MQYNNFISIHYAWLMSAVTGEEVYSLAVAVFNARNHGGGKFIINKFAALIYHRILTII
jgi:chemotaxis methyl-accepting protein methylase